MANKLLLITTGGTISQSRDKHGQTSAAGTHSGGDFKKILQPEESGDKYSQLLKDTEIDILPLMEKDSSNVIPADWVTMIDAIVTHYDKYDAFIITHGTNTLAYSSVALSFALGKLGKRVILTGSQVSYGVPGSDAVMNLQNSSRVALDPDIDLAGVMVVFGSHIITGSRAKKTSDSLYDAFTSFNQIASLGRLGSKVDFNPIAVEAHNKRLGTRARYAKDLDIKKKFDLDIISLTEFPGLSAKFFKALVEAGTKGFILRAYGAGDPNVVGPKLAKPEEAKPDGGDKKVAGTTAKKSKDSKPEELESKVIKPEEIKPDFENLREAFEYLREKEIPIVVTTQAPDGKATMDVNEPGIWAHELGAIPARDMSIEAMTVKLAWVLGRKYPYEEISTFMENSVRGEIS